MNILIDTQAIIWFAENNSQLSAKARSMMEDEDNDCFVSMASFWEISIKMNLGKMHINNLMLSEFMDEVVENGFPTLDIRRDHVLEYEKLPLFHRDRNRNFKRPGAIRYCMSSAVLFEKTAILHKRSGASWRTNDYHTTSLMIT